MSVFIASEEEWKAIFDNFQSHADFPYSLGTLDGKHIHVIKWKNSCSLVYDYK